MIKYIHHFEFFYCHESSFCGNTGLGDILVLLLDSILQQLEVASRPGLGSVFLIFTKKFNINAN